MKKAIYGSLALLAIIGLSSCKKQQTGTVEESTSQAEAVVDSNTVVLFDGETLNGWRAYNGSGVPGAWSVQDGCITLTGTGTGEAGSENGGDILFDQKFKDFEFSFEYKCDKGSNSGIFYLAQELPGKPVWYSAPEYQVLDNENHIDAMMGVDGNRQSASLYDMIPAKPQNAKPYGEWNSGKIIVYKGTVLHFQNGEKVVEYHLWTPKWKELVDNSKFKTDFPDAYEHMLNCGGEDRSGYIVLQDHGDNVQYRNLVVKKK